MLAAIAIYYQYISAPERNGILTSGDGHRGSDLWAMQAVVRVNEISAVERVLAVVPLTCHGSTTGYWIFRMLGCVAIYDDARVSVRLGVFWPSYIASNRPQ